MKLNSSSSFENSRFTEFLSKQDPKKAEGYKAYYSRGRQKYSEYPISLDPSNRIKIATSPSARKTRGAKYEFVVNDGEKILHGTTEDVVASRFQKYISHANHPENEEYNTLISKTIRQALSEGKKVYAKMTCTEKDLEGTGLSFADIEASDIALTDHEKRINQNAGRGGGRAQLRSKSLTNAEKMHAVGVLVNELKNEYITPKKKYSLDPKDYTVKLSPNKKEETKYGALYRYSIKAKSSGETASTEEAHTDDEKKTYHYAGTTARNLTKRLSEHGHFARTGKGRGKKAPYTNIRENPHECLLSVIGPENLPKSKVWKEADDYLKEAALVVYYRERFGKEYVLNKKLFNGPGQSTPKRKEREEALRRKEEESQDSSDDEKELEVHSNIEDVEEVVEIAFSPDFEASSSCDEIESKEESDSDSSSDEVKSNHDSDSESSSDEVETKRDSDYESSSDGVASNDESDSDYDGSSD